MSKERTTSWPTTYQDIPSGAQKVTNMDPGSPMTSAKRSQWNPTSVPCKQSIEDRIFEDEIRDHGAMDLQYTEVIKAQRQNRSKSWVLASSENPCRDYIAVWDHLGTLGEKEATLLTLDIKSP